MKIIREETPTGGPNRTPRQEIVALNTGMREVEPEGYLDFSESEGWPWDSDGTKNTWDIQIEAVRYFIVPFEGLDSQAAAEQAGGDDDHGGVYFYPFSNMFLPIGEGDDDGDLNTANFDEKLAGFLHKYGKNGKPQGGTEIMAAIRAGDQHFLGEFGPGGENEKPRDQRPVRARVVFTDGILNDAARFRSYLEQGTRSKDGYGSHGEWDEVWAVCILGEGRKSDGSNPAKDAYDQYVTLAKDHPWIHTYLFETVTNPAEVAEDMALAVAPTQG
jgi:hypothetical protein